MHGKTNYKGKPELWPSSWWVECPRSRFPALKDLHFPLLPLLSIAPSPTAHKRRGRGEPELTDQVTKLKEGGDEKAILGRGQGTSFVRQRKSRPGVEICGWYLYQRCSVTIMLLCNVYPVILMMQALRITSAGFLHLQFEIGCMPFHKKWLLVDEYGICGLFLEITHLMLITCRHFTLTVIVGGGREGINTSVIAGTNEDEATTL